MTPVPAADGGYLRALLGVPFSDEQLAVVTAAPEPQLVIAGAGSGKTTVMAARVVHAVAWHGVRPDAVLGLTFTNKAATELADRVRLALGSLAESGLLRTDPADPGAPTLDDQPTVSTYHAYAASLIKDHALRIGREPDSRLLTEAARWQLALRVVQSARGPFAHLNWTTPTVTQHVLDLDGELSEHLVSSDDVRAFDARVIREVAAVAAAGKTVQAVLDAAEKARARDELLGLVDAYRERKRVLDLVDFGDQVALAAEIARLRPEVGEGERARFAMVFLDEYQDTGVAQRVLLSSLFGDGHPVTAVGDPCQSIYGWRGASIGNLLRFSEHFPRKGGAPFAPLELLTSFRNGEQILRGANTLSAPLRAFVEGRRRPHVEVHELSAGRDEPGEVVTSLHETVVDEAQWLAVQVREAVDEGTPPGEVAVLCRRRSDFGVFHRALVALDLPVEVVGLGGLLEMPEVADVVAVLQLLADATANAAAVRVLTGPRYRIGPRDLKALGSRASHLAQTVDDRDAADPDGTRALARAASSVDSVDVVALSDAIDSPGDPSAYSAEGFGRLLELRSELIRLRPLLTQPIVEAAVGVVSAIGLDVEIEAAPPELAAAMAANLAAFLDHAARFEGIEGESDLAAFLAFLQAAGDKENGLDIGGVSSADTVKLMTVHKAKGLEWDVVAVPALVRKVFPSGQGRPRWTSRAEALPFDLRGDCADLPVVTDWSSKALGGFKSACDEDDLEEERRLAYVAVTRARRLLIGSGHLWGRTRSTIAEPSQFLVELREAVPPADPDREPWFVMDDPAGNPLREQGEPDVAWPAPYREESLARRLAGAGLVRDALEHPAEVSEVFDPEVAEWDREVGQLLDELAAARAPVRDVLLPRTLSASQVVALAEDAEDFARSLARPMPRKPSTAARRGTAFHSWVEHLFDARPLFDTDELGGAADLPDEPDVALADLREAFARTPYAELKPYAVEAPFELVVGGRLLRGRIDAVYRSPDDPDGFDVVDYKTGLRPSNPAAVALQLAIYRLAWAGIAGVPVDSVGAAFLYVRTGELVRPSMASADEIAALLSDHEVAGASSAPVLPEPPHLDTPSVVSAMKEVEQPSHPADDDSGQLALDWS